MPTYEKTPRFIKDYENLTPGQQAKFIAAVQKFVEDLNRDGKPRPGLRVNPMVIDSKIYELTWDRDGRATFEYGASVKAGEPYHIVWRRVGTHKVFDNP